MSSSSFIFIYIFIFIFIIFIIIIIIIIIIIFIQKRYLKQGVTNNLVFKYYLNKANAISAELLV